MRLQHHQYKQYKLPNGIVVKVQGYEDYVLDNLIKLYDVDDIFIKNKDITNQKILGPFFCCKNLAPSLVPQA